MRMLTLRQAWAVLLLAIALALTGWAREPAAIPDVPLSQLPPEAARTLALIKQDGPFPYGKDGTVFNNRERRLPLRERGYYREYTVPTPGAKGRGARRIVAGRQQTEYYYTGDHYNSFRRIRE